MERMEKGDDGLVDSERHLLNFLDSMDNYLILMDPLSSALRQGWLDLASARHSMGASRVNTAMFDHKSHPASTISHVDYDDQETEAPHFTLCKWAPCNDLEESAFEEDESVCKSRPQCHHSGHEDTNDNQGSPITTDNQVQKERLKSLSMFGTLVSPKLRSSQQSFEAALETVVEICNMRASLLHAYDQVQKGRKNTKE